MNKENLILPPNNIEVSGPVIFLAGPIQGAKDWQGEAIRIIHAIDPEITIASPRREYLDGEFVYEKQVDWETKYLRTAASDGVILFWLAKELEHDRKRAYAQTSRFELAEWKIRHECGGAKLVIGIEDGFTGGKVYQEEIFPGLSRCSDRRFAGRCLQESHGIIEMTPRPRCSRQHHIAARVFLF